MDVLITAGIDPKKYKSHINEFLFLVSDLCEFPPPSAHRVQNRN